MKQIIALLILVLFLIGCQPAAQPAAPAPAAPTAPVAQPPAAPTTAPAPVPAPTGTPQSAYEIAQELSKPTEGAAGPTNVAEPAILKEGYLHKVVHPTNGNVQIVRALGGALSLNLRGFNTEPGPGLTVVLHTGDPANGYVVGTLTSASGNYPYSLPNNFDYNKYTKVSIYNKKYNVVWGEADLK